MFFVLGGKFYIKILKIERKFLKRVFTKWIFCGNICSRTKKGGEYMASLLEQMIEAKRRERNRNVLNYSEQPKNVQSALKMAVSYTKASDQPYAGRTAKGHVFATSDQIDIENQIRKNMIECIKKTC